MKRLLIVFLAIALCLSDISGIAVLAKEDDNIARVEFGKKNILTNVAKVTVSGPNSATVSNDKNALQIDWSVLNNQQLDRNGKILIDLSDSFVKGNTDGSSYEITVEYVDKGNGYFNVKYDAMDGTKKYTDTHYMGVTNVLRQKTFVINDANFANGLDGYDLILGFPDQILARSATSATFTSITIKRLPAKYYVRADIEMEEAGHIYNPQIPIKVKNSIKNFSTTEKTVTAKLYAKSAMGKTEWQDEQTVTLGAGETKVIESVPEISTFGLFDYYVELTGDGDYRFVNSTPFSYVNTDPDGAVNERLGYNTHINSQMSTEEEMLDTIEIIKKSNSNLVRDSYVWSYTERSKGTYTFSEKADMQLRLQAENGIRTMFVGGYGNTVYGTPTDRYLPTTEEGITAYANWADTVINRYGGDEAFLWEIWNEPNMDAFAMNSTPEVYAEFAAKVAKLIKEKHPGTELGALSLTGIQVPEKQTKEYISKAVEEGVFDYAEAAALHPYDTTRPPEDGKIWVDVEEQVNIIKNAGYENVGEWNTEIGWTTADTSVSSFTSRDQAAFHSKMFIMLDSIRANEYYLVYDLVDDGNRMTEREDLFGIVANFKYPITGVPFSADEAYVTITNLNNMLAGCGYPDKIETGIDKVWAFKYKSDRLGKDVVAFWRENRDVNEVIRASLGCKEVTLVDCYGNETKLQSDNGVYDIVPDYQVSYLVGDFDNISFGKSNMKVSGLSLSAVAGDRINITVSGLSGNDISAKIVGNDNINLVKSSVNSGTLNASVEFNQSNSDAEEFYLELTKDGKCINLIKLEIQLSDDIVSAVFDAAPLSMEDVSRWEGYVNIKNNSTTRTVDGYVTLVEPTSGSAKRVYTGPIPAEKTARIKIPMPRIYDRGLLPIKYKVDMRSGQTIELEDVGNFAYAPHTVANLDVDGALNNDEWNKKLYFEVNQASQVKQIPDWSGVDDLSAKIYTAWDEENFYIAVEAKDNTFYQDKTEGSMWMGDSLQFGLVYGKESFVGIGNAGTKFSEIGAALTPEGAQMYRWSSEDDSHTIGRIEDCKVEVVRDEDKEMTVYEIALPWSEILPKGVTKPSADAKLGFSLLINDNDGSGRRGWIEYASGIGLTKDTSLFTYLGLYDLR